jgi:predicted nucleotidyltransferase
MPKANLAEALFSTYRRRVLAMLLLHPERSYYVRELARLTDVPPGSLHRELRLLTDAGLLMRKPAGNQVLYRANRDCPVFEELAGFFRKTAGLADVLREALASLAGQIQLAFVFGSVASGKEDASSDIDVLVVGDVTFADVVVALAATRERLGRDVNSVVMSSKDFSDKSRRKERFVLRIVNEPKIYLIGTADVLAELTQDRSA